MSAVFEMTLESEILSPEEITQITGCARRTDQVAWLIDNGWTHYLNRAGTPIIGRLYARLKLAGINPAVLATSGGWVPDFSNLQ